MGALHESSARSRWEASGSGDASASAQETACRDAIIEQIVVTAQKREETAAGRAVPGQRLLRAERSRDAGIESTQDFVGYVPNMTFDRADTYRNSFVMIRGLTQITNADSPLSVVIDGVPQNDQKQFNMRLFDIERIEVLKGPQGTLYGRNAIGGAVNIVTRAPTAGVRADSPSCRTATAMRCRRPAASPARSAATACCFAIRATT